VSTQTATSEEISTTLRSQSIGEATRYWQIVWPEYRLVSEAKIRTWYADAVANDDYGIEKGLCDPDEMARALDSIGNITLVAK
jgi:hypothetical protein